MFATHNLLVILVVGLIAGWLAGKIVLGSGLGIIGDIVVGVIGAFIGRWLFAQFHTDRWITAHFHVHLGFWSDAILSSAASHSFRFRASDSTR